MWNCKPESLMDGILLEEDVVSIPRPLYEQLIRAETERDVLEAVIKNDKYSADTVMQAILVARDSYEVSRYNAIRIDEDAPDPEPESEPEPAEEVSDNA